MENENCLCGRTVIKQFKILNRNIYLCPYCSYEIMKQNLKYQLGEDAANKIIQDIAERIFKGDK